MDNFKDETLDEQLMHKFMLAAKKLRHSARPEGMPFPDGPFGGMRGGCRHGSEEGPEGPEHGRCRRGRPEGPMGTGPMGMGFGHPGEGFGPGRRPEGFGRGPEGMRERRSFLSRERLLTFIAKYPDGTTQKQIAESFGIRPSSASELLNKLEDDGYIDRRPNEADKRSTLIFLTEKGQARAAEVEDLRWERCTDWFGALTDEEKEEMITLLDKIIGNADADGEAE